MPSMFAVRLNEFDAFEWTTWIRSSSTVLRLIFDGNKNDHYAILERLQEGKIKVMVLRWTLRRRSTC